MQKNEMKLAEIANFKNSIYVFSIRGKDYLVDKNNSNFCEIDPPAKYVLEEIIRGTSYHKIKNSFQKKFSQVNIQEVLSDFFTLCSSGFFSTEDKLLKMKNKGRFISALCLIMATDCNLRCKYCFAGGGNYNLSRKKMEKYIAEKAVDFLIHNSGRIKNLSLSFFGGEPLLNYQGIIDTVAYAKQNENKYNKKFGFSITTNATLLNSDLMKFLVKNDFGIIISLDGPKEVNDLNRVFPDSSGTYDVIVNKINEFITKYPEMKKRITVRGTYTIQTPDISTSLFHLRNMGFESISLEAATTGNKKFDINNENIEKVIEEYDKVADLYLESLKNGNEFSFFHLEKMFFQVANGTQKITQCGAGLGYLAVDPEGKLYPCHRLVGDSRYVMGNVVEGSINKKVRDMFKDSNVNNKADCSKCWAKYICGGGCHATAIQYNNDIQKPYKIECELMKHRIKLGTWIYSQIEGN
jgi:uncharacterized protein